MRERHPSASKHQPLVCRGNYFRDTAAHGGRRVFDRANAGRLHASEFVVPGAYRCTANFQRVTPLFGSRILITAM